MKPTDLVFAVKLKQIGDDEYRIARDEDREYLSSSLGLTKREYFAAMAMQGLISDPSVTDFKKVAEFAVEVADELIKKLKP